METGPAGAGAEAEQDPLGSLALAEGSAPPPTRVGVPAAEVSTSLPAVRAVPESPEPGLWSAARYTLAFARARWERRRVIRSLRAEIRDETAALDEELGALGRRVRELGIEGAGLRDESRAIDDAEARRDEADRVCSELLTQQAEEKAKFAEIEAEKESKVSEADEALTRAQRELSTLEAQRRGLRDKRKALTRQQRGYLKAADDRDAQAARAELQDSRDTLRRAARDLRGDAAGFDSELQDVEERLSALEGPIGDASARVDALKAELESVRRSRGDAQSAHRHRLTELEEEHARRSRELSQAQMEIQRRLVTLGTLVNLHRIDRPELADLYERVDRLRAAIGVRSRAIDRLTVECESYDRGGLVRGAAALAGGGAVIAVVLVLLAALL